MSTIHYFVARPGEEQNLSLNTLFAWKDKYSRELKKNPIVKEFPSAKRGHPLLLGNELDAGVRCFLKVLRANEAAINTAIVMATAEGIMRHYDSNLLVTNVGSKLLPSLG